MQEQEIWKAVIATKDGILYDYSGLYEVSNLGRIRNSRTGRILKPHNNKGYLQIWLSKNGKSKPFRVHRLVAEAFIPNPEGLETVNHKNFDKSDNRVENLEWLSRADNIKHSYNSDKERGEEHKRKISETLKKKVLCIETGQIFDSIKEACEYLGLDYKNSEGNISSCLKGRLKSAYKYHWKYVTELD